MANSSTRSARSLRRLATALALGTCAILFSPLAEAHWHGGWGWGWHGWGCCGWGWGWGGPRVSVPLGWPGYYGYNPYPYYPPYSYAPPNSYAPPYGYAPSYGNAPPSNYAPPTQQQPPAQAQSWYHCDNPQGYYPYVQSCSSGWRQVPATPPGSTSSQTP